MSGKVSPEVATQVLCGATLGLIAAARLFIRGQTISVSQYLRSLAKPRHVALSQVLFLLGLASGGLLLTSNESAAVEAAPAHFPVWKSALAGLLIGVGSSVATGCDFGHGCCGAASLSPRSLVFVVGAVAAAIGSATFFESNIQLQPVDSDPLLYSPQTIGQAFVLFSFTTIAMALSGFFGQHDDAEIRRGVSQAPKNFALYGGDYAEGVLFSYAAALGGIVKPSQVAASLSLSSPDFRPTLWYVLAGAVTAALPAFISIYRISGSVRALSGAKHTAVPGRIDVGLVIGAVAFGLGWGLAGLTPATALITLPIGSPAMLIFTVSMMGAYFVS